MRDHPVNIYVSLILVLNAIHTVSLEYHQLKNQGIEYFFDFWNIFDNLPPFFVTVTVCLFFFSEERYKVETALMSVSSLIMWMKVLNFFRMHEETGYLVRMLF
jgi:hypothetical protein